MKLKHKRFLTILSSLVIVIFGLYLILSNFNKNIVFFYTPTEVIDNNYPDKIIRIGGMVKENSVIRLEDGLTISFILTDLTNEIRVEYRGLLPNLFREKQGIVAKGIIKNKIFIASELLVKHDENYMPPEVFKGYIKISN